MQANTLQPLSIVWYSLGQLNVASEHNPRRVQVDRQSPQSRRLTHSYQCSVRNRLGAEKGIYDLDTKVPERGGGQHWCMWAAGYVPHMQEHLLDLLRTAV